MCIKNWSAVNALLLHLVPALSPIKGCCYQETKHHYIYSHNIKKGKSSSFIVVPAHCSKSCIHPGEELRIQYNDGDSQAIQAIQAVGRLNNRLYFNGGSGRSLPRFGSIRRI